MATYSYLANSPLVSQIAYAQGSTTRMTTSKQYDYLNRLTGISSAAASAATPSFVYSYNAANQRTKDKLVDGSYWVYGYDALGQVTGGHKYFYDGTGVPGQQFDYAFDTIGNRTQSKAGGDAAGGHQRVASYTVNVLNQLTARDYPGTNDVIGAALATNAVTVNGQAAWRKGEYFWSTVATNNAASPAWLGAVVASGGAGSTGNVYLAQTPEQFSYDADGNLTNDGRWSYTWDAENRLASMTVNTNVGPQYQLTFAYDAKGRRIQKVVATNNGTAYIGQSTNNFVYDGWNLIGILNPAASLVESFTWGKDLSGSMQGAGGVGGLLAVSYHGTATTNCFPAYDGNGNVAALVNVADGTLAANYEYGPFGEVIRATGPMAKANTIRFSTKYQDDESDLLYYGYRYYKASTGAWLSRDPITERGGKNLYALVDNSPIASFDKNGKLRYEFGGGGATLCGGWRAQWNIYPEIDGEHWLVQEVTVTEIYIKCCDIFPTLKSSQWYEATRISANAVDSDYRPVLPLTFGGERSVSVTGKLFEVDDLTTSVIESWGHQVNEAPSMYSTYGTAGIWNNYSVGMATRSSWNIGWACCSRPAFNGIFGKEP